MAEVDLAGGDPRQRPHRRVQPQRLAEHRPCVGKLGVVGGGRGTVAEHRSELGAQPPCRVGIQRQQVPRPGQRPRRRLMTGQKQRHRLVPDLGLGQPPVTAVVLEHDQVVDQVGRILRGPVSAPDQRQHHPVEIVACAVESACRRQRQVPEQLAAGQQKAVEHAHPGLEHIADLRRLRLDVGVEDRPADDVEREVGHRHVDVELHAIRASELTCAPRPPPSRRRRPRSRPGGTPAGSSAAGAGGRRPRW